MLGGADCHRKSSHVTSCGLWVEKSTVTSLRPFGVDLDGSQAVYQTPYLSSTLGLA